MRRRRFLQVGLLNSLAGSLVSTVKGAPFDDMPTQQSSGALSPAELSLENDFLAVKLSPLDGALAEIRNKLTGETETVSGTTFEIHTDHGTLLSGRLPLIHSAHSGHTINLTFRHSAVTVEVQYELRPERRFLTKTISVANNSNENVTITDIIADRLRFTPAFREAYAHDDGTDWKCPLNVFLRTKKGGFFTGIENPYFEMVVPGAWKATRLELRYSPRWVLHAGETFVGEPSFLGVYKKEGIYFFKQMQSFAYMSQSQIVMDWGEVWAMQDFLRAIQPQYELPYRGYYFRGNGSAFFSELSRSPDPTPFGQPREYWQQHSQARFEAAMVAPARFFVDELAKQGNIRSIDWGTIWLGNAAWCRESPGEYLEKLDESWPIQANAYWKETVEYAKQKGFGVGIMDEGGARDYLKYESRWKILDKAGRPIEGYVQMEGKMGRNCWANAEFAQWWVDIVSRAIEEYDVPIWGTDSGSIWWVPFDPPLECYSRDHGHPAGECGYYAWRNITWASGELRRRHPRCALRNAGGLHRGYPWILRDWIEFHAYLDPVSMSSGLTVTDNIRFQLWHTHNLRFVPPYKCGGGARTDDRYGMGYGFFSNLNGSDHGEVGLCPPLHVTDPEEREEHLTFFNKWAKWANENAKFMTVRREILGEPRIDGLDGTAHCVGDRGFIFIFNPSTKERAAQIPLNRWIGLEHGDAFSVREIYPAENQFYGTYRNAEDLLVPIPSHQVVVVQIERANGAASGNRPSVSAEVPIDKAFLTAEEVRSKLHPSVHIPDYSDSR